MKSKPATFDMPIASNCRTTLARLHLHSVKIIDSLRTTV